MVEKPIGGTQMKTSRIRRWVALLCVGGALGLGSNAGAITITSGGISATLDLATLGASGPGNSSETDINNEFAAFAPWTLRDDGNDTNGGVGPAGYLTVVLDSGSSWGTSPASGTWTLNPSYWMAYEQAVISIHVGGNPQTPPDDHYSFLIKQGETSGTWSFTAAVGTHGAGLSNLRLFSSGTNVPDGGGTLALMGLALGSLAAGRRFLKK